MEIELQKVHHVAVQESVCEIAQDAGDEQGHGHSAEGAGKHALPVRPSQTHEGSQRNGSEGPVGILGAVEQAKSDARIGRVMEPEEIGDDRIVRPMKLVVPHDPGLGAKVEQIEGQGKEGDQSFHEGKSQRKEPDRWHSVDVCAIRHCGMREKEIASGGAALLPC